MGDDKTQCNAIHSTYHQTHPHVYIYYITYINIHSNAFTHRKCSHPGARLNAGPNAASIDPPSPPPSPTPPFPLTLGLGLGLGVSEGEEEKRGGPVWGCGVVGVQVRLCECPPPGRGGLCVCVVL